MVHMEIVKKLEALFLAEKVCMAKASGIFSA